MWLSDKMTKSPPTRSLLAALFLLANVALAIKASIKVSVDSFGSDVPGSDF